jgi:hypothetical protein
MFDQHGTNETDPNSEAGLTEPGNQRDEFIR